MLAQRQRAQVVQVALQRQLLFAAAMDVVEQYRRQALAGMVFKVEDAGDLVFAFQVHVIARRVPPGR